MKVSGVTMTAMVIFISGWSVRLIYRSSYRRKDQLSRASLAVCNTERDDARKGNSSEGDSLHRSSEGMRNDPILKPKHKIFLSHSGAQKEFVDHLFKALKERSHNPFFDRRHESLPKGERFPELIVQAAEQCEMLIVVVSDEYFMSKWPMIELNAFVRAHKLHHESKSSTIGPKILPLFYGLSVHDLEDASKQTKWFQKWETLARADRKQRIVVHDWKYALDVLVSFNGISYDTNLKEIVAYEEKIVSYVCKSIAPDRKWDDSHMQGKSSIHKIIDEKIEGIAISRRYNIKVVGIFGIGGVGKTTTCKTMCNELWSKYEGRVCHLEFPIAPSTNCKEFFQQALQDLTRTRKKDIKHWNEGECKHILLNNLPRHKIFVAIDNISDHHQSILQAKMFLKAPYHKDSLVVVTARSQSVLELLGIDRDACVEMPDLEEEDAIQLFLHHAIGGKQFSEEEEKHDIMTCIRRCYFSKGDGQGHHYHPLALQALGLQLGCLGESPCDWVKHLPQVRAFDFLSGENPVFGILKSSFEMLLPMEQTLFMDVGCFPFRYQSTEDSIIDWVYDAHKQDKEELTFRLERLKQKGLLLDVDMKHGRVHMHDLHVEFAELEMKGSFNKSTNLKERMWVYIKSNDLDELESKPEDGCWSKLARLTITQNSLATKDGKMVDEVGGMGGMKWNYFSKVEVLQLVGLQWGHGALNLEGMVRLRILHLHHVSKLDKIEGLEVLKHLTYFSSRSGTLFSRKVPNVHIVGQLPFSLRRLDILGGHVVLGSNALARCRNLSKLHLVGVKTRLLDLSNCGSLEHLELFFMCKFQSLSGLAIDHSFNFQSLGISHFEDMVNILGLDQLVSLKKLWIDSVPKCEMPNLLALTKLEVLGMLGEQSLTMLAKDCFSCHLRELRWRSSGSWDEFNLLGFNQLEFLDLSFNDGLTSLAELGDLPLLQCLDLMYCKCLERLPNLSMLRNLTQLELKGCCALELHDQDIQVLSKLPLLQPVHFSTKGGKEKIYQFRLDCARGKVLMHSTSLPPCDRTASEWEEQDLGKGGIQLGSWVWSVNGNAL